MRQLKITKSITNRESASFEKYLQDIGKEELLTADEEVALARRIKAGDERALDKLVRANLRFVVSVAKQYLSQGLSLPDMINEGNLGLIKAAKRFDETRGFKFISYAVWWIRQSIMQAVAEQARIVRLPSNKITILNKIKNATESFYQKFNRNPSSGEIGEILGLSEHDVSHIPSMSLRTVSLDNPVRADEDTTYLEMLKDENSPNPEAPMFIESLRTEINRSLSYLTPREIDVVEYYFGLNNKKELGLEEIGEKFNLTRERVRQIKEKALKQLKQISKNKHLKPYLG